MLIINAVQLSSMEKVSLRFYGELNVYLPVAWRQRAVTVNISPQTRVGEILESCDVPASEVDLILANTRPVDLDYQLRTQDLISVYPKFRSIDIAPLNLMNRGAVH